MKKFLFAISAAIISLTCAADDRPINPERLPNAAKTFISTYFPETTISHAQTDDDIFRPDYTVILSNGAKIEFSHDGSMEKVESRTGIPEELIPVQIREYVQRQYPDAVYVEYEIDRNHYEVGLSNRLELRFNKDFNLVEVDN